MLPLCAGITSAGFVFSYLLIPDDIVGRPLLEYRSLPDEIDSAYNGSLSTYRVVASD
jgi:hypothetical protein